MTKPNRFPDDFTWGDLPEFNDRDFYHRDDEAADEVLRERGILEELKGYTLYDGRACYEDTIDGLFESYRDEEHLKFYRQIGDIATVTKLERAININKEGLKALGYRIS
jgi:hypothetical protein